MWLPSGKTVEGDLEVPSKPTPSSPPAVPARWRLSSGRPRAAVGAAEVAVAAPAVAEVAEVAVAEAEAAEEAVAVGAVGGGGGTFAFACRMPVGTRVPFVPSVPFGGDRAAGTPTG